MKGSEKKKGIRKFFSRLIKKKEKHKEQSSDGTESEQKHPEFQPDQLERKKDKQDSPPTVAIETSTDRMDTSKVKAGVKARIPDGTVKTYVQKFDSQQNVDDEFKSSGSETTNPRAQSSGLEQLWSKISEDHDNSQKSVRPKVISQPPTRPTNFQTFKTKAVSKPKSPMGSSTTSPFSNTNGTPNIRHIRAGGPNSMDGKTNGEDRVNPGPSTREHTSPSQVFRTVSAPITHDITPMETNTTRQVALHQPPGHPTPSVIHYHVTLQNCDGVNIHVTDRQGALSPRAAQYEANGALRRLSWIEGGLGDSTTSSSVDTSSGESPTHYPGTPLAAPGCSGARHVKGASEGNQRNVKVNTNLKLSESPPAKTLRVTEEAQLTHSPHNHRVKVCKSTPELSALPVPDLSTLPKSADGKTRKGKGRSKRRRRRPKSQCLAPTESSSTVSSGSGSGGISMSECEHSGVVVMDNITESVHRISPDQDRVLHVSDTPSDDISISSVLSHIDTPSPANEPPRPAVFSEEVLHRTVLVSQDSNSLSEGDSSPTDQPSAATSPRPFPWHSTKESVAPPAKGEQRRLVRTGLTNSVQSSDSVLPLQHNELHVIRPKLANVQCSGKKDNMGRRGKENIASASDTESSCSISKPIAMVRPVQRIPPMTAEQTPPSRTPSVTNEQSPPSRAQLELLQLEHQRGALLLQLQQEQERAAILDDLQRQQVELEEEIEQREAEFRREESERRSRRHRHAARDRAHRADRAERSEERRVEGTSNTATPNRERRPRVEIRGPSPELTEVQLSPEVEAEIAAMEEAFRREVAERRSRRYRRHHRENTESERPSRSTERTSRGQHIASQSGQRLERGHRRASESVSAISPTQEHSRSRAEERDGARDIEYRRRPRSLSNNRSSDTSRNRLNRSNSVSVPESDDQPLPRHLLDLKNQLVSVPGVLIVGGRRGKLVAYISRDRPNIDGVVRFMVDHNIGRAEYDCEIVPYRYRKRMRGQAAGTSVLVAS